MAERSSERELIVFADTEGNYYQVPRTVFEQARVPEEQKAALERALGQEEVKGFAFDAFQPVGVALPDPTGAAWPNKWVVIPLKPGT